MNYFFFAFDLFVWVYVEDQVYSQSANMLDELKAQITATIADVLKNTLQRVWQEVDYTLDVCRNEMTLIVKYFASNSFSTYV